MGPRLHPSSGHGDGRSAVRSRRSPSAALGEPGAAETRCRAEGANKAAREAMRKEKSMSGERVVGTTLPHSSFGSPDCCGCPNGVTRRDEADLVCNECWAIVRTVAAGELERTIHEMELSLEVATAKCPHCAAVHVQSGFSKLLAFVCAQCGRGMASCAPIANRRFPVIHCCCCC
jgi:hypothetical protein